MKHCFVIQCHEYEPAVKLGKLIESISDKFQVLYAYDNKCADRKLFRELPNAWGFSIGYFTVDQGLYHLLLWYKVHESPDYRFVDYFHVISANDLPFRGILRIDDLVGNFDMYGYYHIVRNKRVKDNLGLPKGITWYGISRDVVNYIHQRIHLLIQSVMDIWFEYSTNRDFYTGSFDEYMIGKLFSYLVNIGDYNMLSDTLRLVFYPDLSGEYSTDGVLLSDFGKRANNKTSPLTLEDTPATVHAFNSYNVLFGRKFEFNSESYNKFYNILLNYGRK